MIGVALELLEHDRTIRVASRTRPPLDHHAATQSLGRDVGRIAHQQFDANRSAAGHPPRIQRLS